MKAPNLKTWSERQQVLAIILMAGAAIFALWFFLLLPQNRRRHELERDIASMQSQLASRNYLVGESALLQLKNEELVFNERQQAEWTNMVVRLGAFQEEAGSTNARVGHIDYKVALFEVRQQLLKKSRDKNIRIRHYDFGMEETLFSNEDARKRMLQLKTVARIVDFALDLQVTMLRDITPLPPMQHRVAADQAPFVEEYPVEIECYGSMENLFQLFDALRKPDSQLVLRRFRCRPEASRPDVLRIQVVLSALMFLKQPGDLVVIPKTAVERLTPLGH